MAKGSTLTLRSALATALALCALTLACGVPDSDESQLRTVHVAGVRIDPVTSSPLVELVEDGERGRSLAIWVGEFEAESIARAIEHAPSPRPNPHDLLKSLLDQIHGRVRRTVVTELRGGTYFAVIELELRGRSLAIDARPSDAIAVALRADAPVLVRDSLFRDVEIPDDEGALEIDWSAQKQRECAVTAPL
jgi:bifunctional DNase/RNase